MPSLSTTPNRPQAPVKSRFQIACPRISGERRVEHAFDLGLASDPLGERDTCLPVLFQAHRERAQAPLAEIKRRPDRPSDRARGSSASASARLPSYR